MKNELSGWYVASVAPPVAHNIGKHRYQGWLPCIQWCSENFPHSNQAPLGTENRWRFISEGIFEFREETDYIMFLLRWG